ncbi:MAG: ergothioneine biosynthesis protein EgtB [Gemmatimonadetes bacterium]|nr:ergothioneine biosynthesis protein EgtB [Gemmatimonadota bacterium]
MATAVGTDNLDTRKSSDGRLEERVTRGPPGLSARYSAVRAQTEALCRPLEVEDYVVSTMTEVSPAKWHLAHTSWFFETFVLSRFQPSYASPDPRYAYLFNSYYVQLGERHCRAKRGLVTRPTVAQVFTHRAHVDEHMALLLDEIGDDQQHPAAQLVELGLQHEQQHQELMLTDIKHVFWMNPLRPAYATPLSSSGQTAASLGWYVVPEGIYRIGHGGPGFAFDNEGPVHRVFAEEFFLASRLVTNAEYLAFVEVGGYRRPELWLVNGWAMVQDRKWRAPIYWEETPDGWAEFTLCGMRALDLNEPVCHVSYYEADAFARWAGYRLPTEVEWEIAAHPAPVDGTFAESNRFHPARAPGRQHDFPEQLYGDLWQWTSSAYVAYPGYQPASGPVGEYNGKWMSDQWVLRGASCATPRSHARLTYRNFFPSDARWQFAGIRLAA